jgi:DNA-binding MarR family transcriptional regulator
MMQKPRNNEPDSTIWLEEHGLTHARMLAFGALMRAHAATLSRIEARLAGLDVLSLEWYGVLLTLEAAPEGRLRMGELGSHVALSRSGLTRLVDRLEAAELVTRRLNPEDRRSFEVSVTPQGRAERARSWPTHARLIAEEFGARFSDEEATQLSALLRRQFQNLPSPQNCNKSR